MKILSWNIRHGGGKRTPQIIESICAYDPDVAVVLEYRDNPSGALLRQRLAEQGMIYQQASPVPPKVNGVLVASTQPLEVISLGPMVDGYAHRVVGIRLTGINLLAFYFPCGKTKVPLFDYILDLPQCFRIRPTLLIGDFNTGLHRIDERGATLIATDRFERMLAQGWIDAWRHFHGPTLDYTWYSAVGNGFRIDHAFCSPALLDRLTRVEYSHIEREQLRSDHSVLLVELGKTDPCHGR